MASLLLCEDCLKKSVIPAQPGAKKREARCTTCHEMLLCTVLDSARQRITSPAPPNSYVTPPPEDTSEQGGVVSFPGAKEVAPPTARGSQKVAPPETAEVKPLEGREKRLTASAFAKLARAASEKEVSQQVDAILENALLDVKKGYYTLTSEELENYSDSVGDELRRREFQLVVTEKDELVRPSEDSITIRW